MSLDILAAEIDVRRLGRSINGVLYGLETKVPHLMRLRLNTAGSEEGTNGT